MDVTPLIPKGRHIITGYGEGGFKIDSEFMSGSLLVSGDRVLAWPVNDDSQVTLESLLPIIETVPAIDLLLIGMGENMGYFEPSIRQELKRRGISVDVMDTGAACRTYNVLLSEERRVAAAVIAV